MYVEQYPLMDNFPPVGFNIPEHFLASLVSEITTYYLQLKISEILPSYFRSEFALF